METRKLDEKQHRGVFEKESYAYRSRTEWL
jgi:hypothetical protein